MKFWTLASLASLLITYLFFSFISWSWFDFGTLNAEGAWIRMLYLMFSVMSLMGISVINDQVRK